MLDRITQPTFHPLNKVSIPKVNTTKLDNGTSLATLDNKSTSVFKLELIFKAGSWYASNYHLVPLTLKMLNEGTLNRSGKNIAEAFDKLGSFIELTPGFDHCTLAVYGLSKYLEANLQLIAELTFQPSLESVAFKDLKTREAHKLELNLEKSSYKASTLHRSNIFGAEHPYGIRATPRGFHETSLEEIERFYGSNFGQFDILISGNLSHELFPLINKYFGNQSDHDLITPPTQVSNQPSAKQVEERNNKFIQSSIRIGRPLFNRNHPDYMNFMVLNEVLGGYFGSRLMKNIREDKGFTYGIYSQLYALNHAGYFTIGTDVNSDNEPQTIKEILFEINRLKSELVPETELATVKNYMTGTYAGALGTPFAIMDKYKAVHYQGLDLSFFDNYVERVNAVSANQLLDLANKYLKEEELSSAIVGR